MTMYRNTGTNLLSGHVRDEKGFTKEVIKIYSGTALDLNEAQQKVMSVFIRAKVLVPVASDEVESAPEADSDDGKKKKSGGKG